MGPLLDVDPADLFCVRIGAARDDPGAGTLQVGNLNVVVLPDIQPVELFRGEQFLHMAVAGEGLGLDRTVMDVGSQKLLIDTATKEGHDGYIKLFGVHIVDQVHQNFFSAAVTQVVDEKKDFSHIFKSVNISISYIFSFSWSIFDINAKSNTAIHTLQNHIPRKCRFWIYRIDDAVQETGKY